MFITWGDQRVQEIGETSQIGSHQCSGSLVGHLVLNIKRLFQLVDDQLNLQLRLVNTSLDGTMSRESWFCKGFGGIYLSHVL